MLYSFHFIAQCEKFFDSFDNAFLLGERGKGDHKVGNGS